MGIFVGDDVVGDSDFGVVCVCFEFFYCGICGCVIGSLVEGDGDGDVFIDL